VIRGFVGDWFGLFFIVALIYLLVRPGSKAAETVGAVGGMLVAIVRQATDIANAN
jgi:hypothetical protein